MLISILTIQCFGTLMCIFSPFLYICLFPTFVEVYRTVPLGGIPIAVNRYHILSHHETAPWLEFIALYLSTVTTFNHCRFSFVSKTQHISDTDGHAIQTKVETYNSVRVQFLITSVRLATSTDTPGATFYHREVM
jgi:hypothetical protein